MGIYQDFNVMAARAVQRGRGGFLVNQFRKEGYLDKLKEYLKTLQENQDKLNYLEEQFIKNMTQSQKSEFFKSGGILDQLEIVQFFGFDLDEYISQYYSDYDKNVQDFLKTYVKTKHDFLDIADKIQTKNANIMGTNPENQYYTIFLKNTQKDGAQLEKMIRITREQYDQFEKANPQFFKRTSSGGYELKFKEANAQAVYDQMKITLGEENMVDILDQVYAVNNRNSEQQYNLTTRTLYHFLEQNKTLIEDQFGNKLSSLSAESRRIELLFDNQLINGIQQIVMNNGQINGNNLQIKGSDIIDWFKTSNINFNNFKGENIAGAVAGDIQFMQNGVQNDYQMKMLKGYVPFHGRGYQAVMNNIQAQIDMGERILADPSMMLDLEWGRTSGEQFLEYFNLGNNELAYQHYEAIGYQTVGEYFLTEANGNFTVTIV